MRPGLGRPHVSITHNASVVRAMCGSSRVRYIRYIKARCGSARPESAEVVAEATFCTAMLLRHLCALAVLAVVTAKKCHTSDVRQGGDEDPWLFDLAGCTALSIVWKSLGDKGATALAVALQRNSAITRLRLGFNKIGDAGAAALAEALRSNGAFTALDLEGNSIGDAGATALGEALTNGALATLALGSNSIGEAGARALAQGLLLKGNRTLAALDLRWNEIGDEGAKALGEALRSNRALAVLCFQE